MAMYAAAIKAQKQTLHGINQFMTVCTLNAISEAEAEGLALNVIRERCKQSEGWTCHTAVVVEIVLNDSH